MIGKIFSIELSERFLSEKAERSTLCTLHSPSRIFFDLTRDRHRVSVKGTRVHDGRSFASVEIKAENSFALPGLKEAVWLYEDSPKSEELVTKWRVVMMQPNKNGVNKKYRACFTYLLVKLATIPLAQFERSTQSCKK